MPGAHRTGGPAGDAFIEGQDILFLMQAQITALAGVKQDAKAVARRLKALQSRDLNIVTAGNTMDTTVPELIDQLLVAYSIMVHGIEDWQLRL